MDKPGNARVAIPLFVAFVGIYLLTASADVLHLTADGREMLDVARRVADHGFGEVPGTAWADSWSRYPPGQSILDLAILAPADVLAADPAGRHPLAALAVSCLPVLLSALVNVLVFWCARRLGAGLRTAALAAGIHGLATMQWPYAQTLFSEPAVTLAWLLAFAALLRFRDAPSLRWLAAAGLAAGFAAITRVTALLALPAFAGYGLWLAGRALSGPDARRPARWVGPALAIGVPMLAMVAVALAFNAVRSGDALDFGYGAGRSVTIGFGTPLLVGLSGLLLSTGKGVFFYNPTLLLSLAGARRFARGFRAETVFIAVLVATQLPVLATWWAWHGDFAWGPRMLLPLLPFAGFLALPFLESLAARTDTPRPAFRLAVLVTVALVLSGVAVQSLGVAIRARDFLLHVAGSTRVLERPFYDETSWPIRDDLVQVHFVPEFSPIAGHAWMLRCATLRDDPEAFAACAASPPWAGLNPKWVAPPADPATWGASHFWWAALLEPGRDDTLPGLALAAGLLAMTLWGLVRVMRAPRSPAA